MEYFNELISILNEMSPYLILGFFISGILHVYVPRTLYSKFLHRKGYRSVVGAAILGVPLPLCSCGVIPTAMSLRKEGASDGATVSFLVGTPQTGIDSILATYSLLGLPFAIIRPISAFFVAIFSGILIDKFGKDKPKKIDFKKLQFAPQENSSSKSSCGCGCGCTNNDEVKKEASERH
ncbi:MAG: permease [Bacteroidales bacterium]